VNGLKIKMYQKLCTPNSLRDSNVSPNWKQRKSKELGHAPWLATLWRGRGVYWSFEMGLGRIDKLQLLTWTYTKPTQGGWCIIGALLVLGRVTNDSYSQDSPRPRLGEATTFPLIIYYATLHMNHIQMVFCPGSPEIPTSRTPAKGSITSRAALQLEWSLKQSCSLRQKIFTGMSHTACMLGNRGDSQLLMVESQIVSLTLSISFDHNLCFKCPNGQCKRILYIYVSIAFQWYKELFK
jgi:hypothetical protein